jgi:predicted RNase H-like HicB family nuclease
MAQRISIAVKVLATVEYDNEAGVFVSNSPALKIFSQGQTEDEAREALEEAIEMQLVAAYKFDRLHQLLFRAGFTQMVGGNLGPQALESIEGQYVRVMTEKEVAEKAKQFEIEVPLELIAAAANNPGWQLSH